MKKYKKLAINTGLAFLAGAASAFAAFMAATPENPGFSAIVAALSGAAYAGLRFAAGYLALEAKDIPAIPVDE